MLDKSNHNSVALWSWSELTLGVTGRTEDGPLVTSVDVDSRKIQPGGLFVALPGDPGPRFNPGYRSSVDGHDFVAAAAAAGAAGAMVHKARAELDVPDEFPLLQVADTYEGLWTLGRAARARLIGDVVAITGSSGKTTAKTFLRAALQGYAPPGSFNNHIGVPLSLANAPSDTEAAVFEVGTNHPGEIGPLAEMVAADVAVLLNVHFAHIANFADQAELRSEKICIFNGLKDKSMAVSEDLLELGFGCTFGATPTADASVRALDGDVATISLYGETLRARVPGGGMHRAKTVAATLLVCHLLGRDTQPACDLPDDTVPAGRGDMRRIGSILLVDDSYNANPDSMQAGIASFAKLQGPQRRVAVVGEMLELGDVGAAAHLGLARSLQEMDLVYCVGEGTRALARELGAPWFAEAAEELLQALVDSVSDDTAVWVKGSNRVFWARGFVTELAAALEQR